MSRVILLDAGPLGLLANANPKPRGGACNEWLVRLRRRGTVVQIPLLVDFEVRRSLMLDRAFASLDTLDRLVAQCGHFVPATRTIRIAADLWADLRRRGRSVGPDRDLQADVILAAQALELTAEGYETWIATDNLRHLRQLYRQSALWEDIGPD